MPRTTRRRFLQSAGTAVSMGVASTFRPKLARTAEPTNKLSFRDSPGKIVITAGAQLLATYVFADSAIPRPYFAHVHAPGGVQVTRNHPPVEGVDLADHPTFHPGLWLAFGDLRGADTWRNKARVEHVEFVQTPHAEGTQGRFSVRNRYVHESRPICDEECTYTFLLRPTGYLLLWDSTFRSEQRSFWFGDQEEMGLGLRVATPIAVKSKAGGRILDSENRKNEKSIWGKTVRWCDYSGRLDNVFAGVTIMPDPDNFRACWWHTRDYGFMAANPFGRAAFRAGSPSRVEVESGTTFRLRFGVLLHANPTESDFNAAAAYQDFLGVLQR